MRSLRARLFLTLWPLFVVAILAVGALSSRSARVELAQFESRMLSDREVATTASLGDSVASTWSALRGPEGPRILQRLATRVDDSLHLVVTDTTGALIATTDSMLTPRDISMTARGDIDVVRTLRRGDVREVRRILVGGMRVNAAGGVWLGWLYQLPASMPRPSGAATMVAGIERSVWLAVLLACVLAAAGTWVLAYPVVAQVQRLTTAAHSVQSKALSTRVRVSSRDELGALEQSFNSMAESLERTEVAKRQLISDVAHELRTPLTNVIGQLEAMRDGLRAPDAATLLSTHEEALLLKELINELQDLAVADAGEWRFDLRVLDAAEEVQRAVDAFLASGATIEVTARTPGASVVADPRRLAQVLRNLLQNALTHTLADGRIGVAIASDGTGSNVIEVVDTGSGIPAEHLPLIWERFYRVDASRDRSTGGMGLGLALTKRLVEGMGGSIAVVSTVGVGTRFTVRLPAGEQSAS